MGRVVGTCFFVVADFVVLKWHEEVGPRCCNDEVSYVGCLCNVRVGGWLPAVAKLGHECVLHGALCC